MSDGMVRKWVRPYEDGRKNIPDKERIGRHLVISDDFLQKVDEKVKMNRRFTISSLSEEFFQVSRRVLYEIITERLNYRKLCSRWTRNLLIEAHKNKSIDSALIFLVRYDAEDADYLSQIVTGDETWLAYVTPVTKQQSMD